MMNDARLQQGPVFADLDEIEHVTQIGGGRDRFLPPCLQMRGRYAQAMADTEDAHILASDLCARLLSGYQIGKTVGQQRVVEPVLEVCALELARRYGQVEIGQQRVGLVEHQPIGAEHADLAVARIQSHDEEVASATDVDTGLPVVDLTVNSLFAIIAQIFVHQVAGQNDHVIAGETRADVLRQEQVHHRAVNVEIAPILAKPDRKRESVTNGLYRANNRQQRQAEILRDAGCRAKVVGHRVELIKLPSDIGSRLGGPERKAAADCAWQVFGGEACDDPPM